MLAASGWFGEVIVINFVLIPVLSRYKGIARKDFLNTIFPSIFRLASVLAATTAISGGVLLYFYTRGNFYMLLESLWGICILIGGSMGLILTLFHFFLENKLARKAGVGDDNISQEAVEDIHLKLTFIPRIGLLVISAIFMLMMIAVRGT